MIVLWLQKWLGAAALKIVWIGAIVLAVLAVLLGARQAGRKAERVEQLERGLDNARRANEARSDAERHPNPSDELRKRWSRD